MSDTIEPLTLTLEQALARLGARGYILAVYGPDDAPKEYVLRDVYSPFVRGSFGHWKDAVEAVLGVPVVPRDDTAELVEALEAALQHGEALAGGYYQRTHRGRPARAGTVSQEQYDEATRAFMAGRAVLARVKNTTAPVTDSSESEVVD